MVNSRLLKAVLFLGRVLAAALDDLEEIEDPDEAAVTFLIGSLLAPFGIFEPQICLLARLLAEALERMREANRLRFRPTFLRVDLLWPAESAALHTLNERHDAAYMQLFRVDVATFDFLNGIVAATSPEWFDARSSGRFNLNAPLCIAAALAWLGSTCVHSWLQQLFGNTRSPMSRDIREGCLALLRALRTVREAAIEWPSPAEMEWYSQLVCQARDGPSPIRHCNIFGWVDGIRNRILQPGVAADQMANYNAWVGDTSVLSLFAFNPTGVIFYASVNHPGRAHDKAISGDFFAHLLDPAKTPAHMGVGGDSAFCSPRLLFKLWTRKRPANWPAGYVDESEWIAFVKWLTASRQAVEWGMRALRGRWARMNVPMSNNAEERADLIELIARLHNLVTRMVGANQIRSVYMEAALRHAAPGVSAEDVAEDFSH